ncbi:hypothetical protein KP509_30G034700 [Ceratopteris richardii]|uniref:Uncharacterized protein n=1 Tax=Ceratopteris richardii TaxID=49495 RepID=A0A8T2R2D1_CERRI|nr:hypothetical protein KP509_30G034700 [Ceratopteris richardii]
MCVCFCLLSQKLYVFCTRTKIVCIYIHLHAYEHTMKFSPPFFLKMEVVENAQMGALDFPYLKSESTDEDLELHAQSRIGAQLSRLSIHHYVWSMNRKQYFEVRRVPLFYHKMESEETATTYDVKGT